MRISTKTKRVRVRKNGRHKVDAASTMNVPIGSMRRLIRPQARFNWLMPNVGSITPQYIETVLNGAMAGNHVQQWWLFDLMLRTWPELLQCYDELVYGVLRKKIVYEAAQTEDENPTPEAETRLKVVQTALESMDDDPAHDGNDLTGTLRDILDAWFRGVCVSEIVWRTIDDESGQITAPQSTFYLQPNNYAYSSEWELGLVPIQQQTQTGNGIFYPFSSTSSQPVPSSVIPFPRNKFLVSVHKAKAGSPLSGPLLTPLAWWWCAANFSSDWLLNLAQVFGLPFRWANYPTNAPQETIDAICNMLQNMGSAAWGAYPEGVTLEMVSPGASQGSDHSPQGELLDRADRYARNLILGQTMTGTHGTTGKGGGQAFGVVEKDVKADRIDAAGRFAENVINKQLIPAILMLNYGDANEAPTIRFLEDEEAGLQEAQRDTMLIKGGLPVGVDFLRKKYGIPKPSDNEETLGGEQSMQQFGGFGFDQQPPQDQQPPNDMQNEPAKAGAKPGHPFYGNQWVRLGDNVRTPNGPGKVVAVDPNGAWVSVSGHGIQKYKTAQLSKISFPSISHSAEDERRRLLNAGMMNKLEELNTIDDDAVFASELKKLVEESCQQ